MGFLGVYRAVYDYAPQADGELTLSEGDVLYVIEKNDDDGWWKAKKKAGTDEEDEPIGLVPHNYVEPSPSVDQARAIYDYTRQTEEELSFPEDAILEILDTSDPDWILAGLDGDYGFVPSNYIEIGSSLAPNDSPTPDSPPSLPVRPLSEVKSEEYGSDDGNAHVANPAAALAGIMGGKTARPIPQPAESPRRRDAPRDEHASEDESLKSPTLPSRPRLESSITTREERHSDAGSIDNQADTTGPRTPGGFHMYNINEMVSVMGKKKKIPTTLGINLGTGTILIAPERAQDDPAQEWTAEKMTHYSREGKHVFMELVRPSKSVDFHAGAKDTAEEIVAALGELAGAVRAEGLREVIMAGSHSSLRKGHILYDFMAQGDDEVTVATGDEVLVLDDSKSDEWWQVRRLKNGKEGVVPSSYVEAIFAATPSSPSPPEPKRLSSKSTVEQNRLEEIRLTKAAIKASKEPQQVGPGMKLPERGSSLVAKEQNNNSLRQRSPRNNSRMENGSQSKSKSKPDASKVRTWTDRSKSFSVEAQFLGLKDGKIHLHKMNGVKIAVPITKMSREDLEYVEHSTGISLEDEKPLADVKRTRTSEKRSSQAGASIERRTSQDYDWFQFFLSCDVAVGLCERYAQAFIKDSMDESVLADVDASVLRNLGLREGDIIKVMRTLDTKFGRDRAKKSPETEEGGGLFSGPRGALRNNTRKGRPAPAVQTSDIVDAATFSKKEANENDADRGHESPVAKPSSASDRGQSGFEDNAWDVKGGTQAKVPATDENKVIAKPAQPTLTGSMKELSLLTAPLEPTKTGAPTQSPAMTAQSAPTSAENRSQSTQPQGATASFFSSIPQSTSPPSGSRQRPTPPSAITSGSIAAPPQRSFSASQPTHQPSYGPQMTSSSLGAVQSQVAPPGQSLNDINNAHLQQQYISQMNQLQPAMTGYMAQQPQAAIASFPTGAAPGQFMQQMPTGMGGPSPFAHGQQHQFSPIQTQSTGFNGQFMQGPQSFGSSSTGNLNSHLPPALEPQPTGVSMALSQQTGSIGYSSNGPIQPLQPQKTGPAPPVRFGVSETKKLTPQQTGRRANLAQATPQNPFGF